MLMMAALLLPVASSSAETVTTLGDSGDGSLRAAIANAAPGETIDFQAGLEGTIELATGLTVAKDLRIAGPGARHLAISGMDVTRVLHVDGAGTELEIDDVTIRDGVTPDDEPFGGGVLVTGGDRVRLTRVAVLNNVAQGTGGPFGGGIAAFVGRLELHDSTVAGNRAAAGGGGIAVGVPFEVVNSTVADNSSGAGAGLLARAGAMGTVRHTTFSGNTAAVKGHAIGADGTSLVTVERSLLPGNGPAGQPPCDGSVASGGGNVSDAPCFAAPAAGDVVAAAPVGALADNGGPTDTMMPLAGNPALGHVPVPCPPSDQRGVARPSGAACDAGAVEAPAPVQPVAPSADPAPPPAPPAPQAWATTTLLSASARTEAGGRFSVRLRCETVAATRCAGALKLRLGARRLSRAFSIAAGGKALVRLRLSPGDRRRLAKRGSLRSAVTLVTTQPDGSKKTTHQGALRLLPTRRR